MNKTLIMQDYIAKEISYQNSYSQDKPEEIQEICAKIVEKYQNHKVFNIGDLVKTKAGNGKIADIETDCGRYGEKIEGRTDYKNETLYFPFYDVEQIT